jgi:hypothetical protein
MVAYIPPKVVKGFLISGIVTESLGSVCNIPNNFATIFKVISLRRYNALPKILPYSSQDQAFLIEHTHYVRTKKTEVDAAQR